MMRENKAAYLAAADVVRGYDDDLLIAVDSDELGLGVGLFACKWM